MATPGRWSLVAVTVAFVVACALPYGIAWSRTPAGTSFTGVVLNHFDQSYYRAAQRSRAERLPDGNRFTTEPGAPAPVVRLYPILGELQRRTGLPPLVAYHLPRVLAGAAFPVLLAWFFRLCFSGRRDVVGYAVVLTLFSTGVLAVAPWAPGASRSPEALVAEANVLRSFTIFPHFAVAYVGLVLSYGAVVMALRRRPPAAVAGVAVAGGLLLAVTHAFLGLAVALVAAAAGVRSLAREVPRRQGFPVTARVVLAGVGLVPVALSVLGLRREHERLEAATGAAFPTMPAGPVWTWAYAFGVVSVLAAAGAVWLARRPGPSTGRFVLATAVAAHLTLMYLPAAPFWRRRFSEGLVLGLGGLAAVGLWWCGRRLQGRRPYHLVGVGGIVLLGALVTVRSLGGSGEHVDDDLRAVMEQVSVGDVVLAGHDVAFRTPAMSDAEVYLGRPVETLRYAAKKMERSRYAERPDSATSLAWLRDAGITVVVAQATDASFPLVVPERPEAACLVPFLQGRSLSAYRVSGRCLDLRAPQPGREAAPARP